jgi:curved DNA-binding protein
MNYKDYYKILGVGKTATAKEIKKAYRQLAIKYHPDKTKGDKVAEEKFKDINEANKVLSDSETRKKYDQIGADWERYKDVSAQSEAFDWSKYANNHGGQTQQMSPEEFESMFSGNGVGDFFELIFGQMNNQKRRKRNIVFKGENLEAETNLSLEEVYQGTTRLIQRNGQKIRVTIKPGAKEQQVLRIAGKGGAGVNGGASGNLYLTIKIAAHPEFQRKGNDLHRDFPVELYTAVLGGKAKVKTMIGLVNVNIPKETSNGTVLRLRGLGMPIYGKKNEFGNLFVKIIIRMPTHLSEQEIDYFGKLAALRK